MTRQEKHEAIQGIIDDAYKADGLDWPANIALIAMLKARAALIMELAQTDEGKIAIKREDKEL